MKLEELKTWNDLKAYLVARIQYATNSRSKSNKSFTKYEVHRSLMTQCLNWEGQDLPIRTKKLLIKRVKRDFGMKI